MHKVFSVRPFFRRQTAFRPGKGIDRAVVRCEVTSF